MESGGASPMPAVPPPRTDTPSSNLINLNSSAPPKIKICVYCGSEPGRDPVHLKAARELAGAMAANNIGLVYGGGTKGLMGELAKTLVSLSGPDSVHGIIPEALVRHERDATHTTTQVNGTVSTAVPEEKLFGRTTVVRDMHTRKRLMVQEVLAGGPGSGFIALSGGYGTLEELLETTTWVQLGIHGKGVCVFNVNGFYDGLLQWIRRCADEGFMKGDNGSSIMVEATSAEDAIKVLREYKVSASALKLAWENT